MNRISQLISRAGRKGGEGHNEASRGFVERHEKRQLSTVVLRSLWRSCSRGVVGILRRKITAGDSFPGSRVQGLTSLWTFAEICNEGEDRSNEIGG